MLKLALCDDNQEHCNIMQEMIQAYLTDHPELTCKIFTFTSSPKLLAAEEDEKFDLFILDVVMPQLSGIDLGKKLRELGSSGMIIYLTVSKEYAMESYATQAFQYLTKPIQKDKLFQVLDAAIIELENHHKHSIQIKTKDGLHLARLDHIMYAELVDRTIHYHLYNNQQIISRTVRTSFQTEIMPLLADSRFALCSAGLLVNLYYVIALEKNSMLLDNGERTPMARSYAAQIRQHWSNYWLNSTRNRSF